MKIFNDPETWSGKVNFVDENNVFVGFNMASGCCEDYDWFLSHSYPTLGNYRDDAIRINDFEKASDGFNFDVDFFERVDAGGYGDGGLAIFRLSKGEEKLYLTLYNFHNGYYAHGFSLNVGGINIIDDSL
jgi:hypothetical protein